MTIGLNTLIWQFLRDGSGPVSITDIRILTGATIKCGR